MTKPHKHAELIKKWADDPSQTVWHWYIDGWWSCHPANGSPSWYETNYYAVGEKPTSPPRKMCVLAGVEFPMPLTEPHVYGSSYWTIDPAETSGVMRRSWQDDTRDARILKSGMAFDTREGAEAYARAIIAATKQAMEAAK